MAAESGATPRGIKAVPAVPSLALSPPPVYHPFAAMVIKTELCVYTEYRVYPGRGQRRAQQCLNSIKLNTFQM